MRSRGNRAVTRAPASSWGWFCPFWQELPHHRLVLLKVECVAESSGRFDETQMAGSHPEPLMQVWGGTECPSLTSSQCGGPAGPGPGLENPPRASVRPAGRREVPGASRTEAPTREPWTAAKATPPLPGPESWAPARVPLLTPGLGRPPVRWGKTARRGEARVGCPCPSASWRRTAWPPLGPDPASLCIFSREKIITGRRPSLGNLFSHRFRPLAWLSGTSGSVMKGRQLRPKAAASVQIPLWASRPQTW